LNINPLLKKGAGVLACWLALLEKGRCLFEGAAGEIKAPKSTKKRRIIPVLQ
jgi:hypothetical protein